MAATAEKPPPSKASPKTTNETESNVEIDGSSGIGTNGDSGPQGAAAVAEKEKRYAVYEVTTQTVDGPAPDELKLVAVVTAEQPSLARWAAVEATPSLKERVTAKDGKSGEEVHLLPVALRYLGKPEPTFEKVDLVIDRR